MNGRQAYPKVYVDSCFVPEMDTPAAHYQTLCRQFNFRQEFFPDQELLHFVRELDQQMCIAESCSPPPQEDVLLLEKKLVEAEKAILPRFMETQTMSRENAIALEQKTEDSPCEALSTFCQEILQARNTLHDIRFRRLPSLKGNGLDKLRLEPAPPGTIGTFTGPGDAIFIPDTQCTFINDSETSSLFLLRPDSSPKHMEGPWETIKRIRKNRNGITLLDQKNQSLTSISSNGRIGKSINLQMTTHTKAPLGMVDMLHYRDQIILACLSEYAREMHCFRLFPESGTLEQIFWFDQNVFMFEEWELWEDKLVFCSSKTNTLHLYSLSDNTWERIELPVCHSYFRGISIAGDMLYLNYPPAILAFNMRKQRMAGYCHAPHIVGTFSVRHPIFTAGVTSHGHALHISSEDGSLNRYEVLLSLPTGHQLPRESEIRLATAR